MIEPIHAALSLLVNTAFSIFTFILMLRILLVFVRSNYFNPLTQFVTRFTDFFVKPLRRYVPNQGPFESASIIWLFLIEMIKFFMLGLLDAHMPHPFGILVLALADMLKLLLQTFFYAILLQAVLSWIQPFSPLTPILYQLTAPIMRPIQRLVPPVGGFDISPLPAILFLQLLLILLVGPFMQIGIALSFG